MIFKTLKVVALSAVLAVCSNAYALQDCGGCNNTTSVDPMINCGRGISQYQAAGMWAGYCNEDCSYTENSGGCGAASDGCGKKLFGMFKKGNRGGCGLVNSGCGQVDDGCGGGSSICGSRDGFSNRLRNGGLFAGHSCSILSSGGNSCGNTGGGCGLLKGNGGGGLLNKFGNGGGCGLLKGNGGGCGMIGPNSGCGGGCNSGVVMSAPVSNMQMSTGCGGCGQLSGCGCKLGFFKRGQRKQRCGLFSRLKNLRLASRCDKSCFGRSRNRGCNSGCASKMFGSRRGLFGNRGNSCGGGCLSKVASLGNCGRKCSLFSRFGARRGGMNSCVSGQLTSACDGGSPCSNCGGNCGGGCNVNVIQDGGGVPTLNTMMDNAPVPTEINSATDGLEVPSSGDEATDEN